MLHSSHTALLGVLSTSLTALASSPPPPTRSLVVYHRFTFSTLDSTPTFSLPSTSGDNWVERGRVDISSGGVGTFESTGQPWDGLVAPQNAAEWQAGGKERYQVAVKDEAGEDLSFVSVDPCTLYTASTEPLQEQLTLSWSPFPSADSSSANPEGHFTGALDYHTSTTSLSPACDASASAKERAKWVFAPSRREVGKLEVKLERPAAVVVDEPPRPAQPKEQQPVRLDKDGKILPPPKEKSFIQKYWMYIVPVLLVMLMTGGEEQGAGKGGGGGAKR
ncbi:hypothetical protein JCM11641_002247 [Rhodosporidiobolus odoratus]